MAGPKRDWQQQSSSQTRQSTVTRRVEDNSWRSTPRTLRSRIASQLGLLRIPVYVFVAAGLVWSLVHVVGWLKPVEQPRLTIVTSTYQSASLPRNTFATADAQRLIDSGIFQTDQTSSASQNNEAVLAAIRSVGQHPAKGLLSKIFNWQRTTEFVYVNTLGVALKDASGNLTPCLLPDDFDAMTPNANETAVPVAELLDAVVASAADEKVVVFDCQRVEQLWSRGVMENQFVASVEKLLENNADRYGSVNVLFSSSAGESTWIDETSGLSAFGNALTSGLQGAADAVGNGDNRVTLTELQAYLSKRVPKWVASNRLGSQQPFRFKSTNGNEVVLALIGSEPTSGESKSVDTKAMLASLKSAWVKHESLAQRDRHPIRFAPTLWSQLQRAMLNAELAFRTSDEGEFQQHLKHADQLATQIEQLSQSSQQVDTPWSLSAARVAVEEQSEHATALEASAPVAAKSDSSTGGTVAKETPQAPSKANQPLAVPIIKTPEVKTLADAVEVVERYLAADMQLAEATKQLRTAHRYGVRLFAEAELMLMLAENQPTPDSQWLANARSVVHGRMRVEECSELIAECAGEVLPWLRADLEAVNSNQRGAEDQLLIGVEDQAIEIGNPALSAKSQKPERILKHARSLAKAFRLRDEVVAELPFFLRAATKWSASGDEFQEALFDHVRATLESTHRLTFALNVDPQSLGDAERHSQIATIDAVADEVSAAREQLHAQVRTAANELAESDAFSESAWQRCDLLFSLPTAFHADSQRNITTRMWLLKRITKLPESSEANIVRLDSTERARLIERREELASLWLSLGDAQAIAIKEPGQAVSTAVARAWQRLWNARHEHDGDSQLAIRQLAESASPGTARAAIDRATAGFYCWQARRRLDDFWAGSGTASDCWFAQSAGEFVAVAERLHGGEDVDAVAGRLNELVELASDFRDATDSSLMTFNKQSLSFRGTDAESTRLNFQPDETWPSGHARLVCSIASADVGVSTVQAGAGYEVTLRRQSAEAKHAVLEASVLFRGHHCIGSLPVSTTDEAMGPTVVYENNLPPSGSISVQLASTGAGRSSLLFVIDASGSMGQDGRMDSVRDSLLRFARAVADTGVNVGVRVFGDRVAWDGTDPRLEAQARADTRLILPVRPFAGEEFRNAVSSLQPRGETPMFRALLDARNDFPTEQGLRRIVVISDGADNWALAGARPGIAELRDEYADSGITIDAVGFQTNADGFRQLQQIAAATGGNVVQASQSDDLLRSLFGLINVRRFEVVDSETNVVVDSGTLGRAVQPTSVAPGDYVVRILDQDDNVLTEHSAISLHRGEVHRLLYSSSRLRYTKMNLTNDLATIRDQDTQTLLRVMNASRDANGLELSLAIAREDDPTWRPRDVEFRIRPRGGRDTFVVRSLEPNIAGHHIPAWRCRLANWPEGAQFAEVSVSWEGDDHAPRERHSLAWDSDGTAIEVEGGPRITRRSIGTIRGADGVSRDVATLTLISPQSRPGDWSFQFEQPPVFAQQVWNRNSGIHTTHVQFESGEAPQQFAVEAPIGTHESRKQMKATVGLRLRSIRQARK